MGTKRPQGQGEPLKRDSTTHTNNNNINDNDNITPDTTATAPAPLPAAKRQRVSRACDQCRSAREKCDGIRPACFPCASQHRDCTWQEPNRKRGVQTGYIRTLEASLGWIFDKFPGAEDALHGLITHHGGQGASLLADRQTASSSRLHRRWMRSSVRKDIDLALSGRSARDASDADDADEADLAIPADEDNKNIKDMNNPNVPSPDDEAGTADARGGRGRDRQRQEQDDDIKSTIAKDPAAAATTAPPSPLMLPQNHWRLLDVYFAYTHAWFPVVEKPELLRTAYTYPSQGLTVTRHSDGSGSHAELWAVFAVAAHQELASQGPRSLEQSVVCPGPDAIYRVARSLIPLEDASHDVGHVNALLLLSQISLGRQNLTVAWMLTGTAVRIALRIGLHRASSPSSLRSRRQTHAYMGCFILDSLVAAMLGSPPHLRSHDMTVAVSAPESDLDEWQPWNPCPGFTTPSAGAAQLPPSRSPAHTISCFVALFEMHKVLTTRLGAALLQPGQRGSGLDDTLRQHAFRDHIVTGRPAVASTPPAYMLRLAYLCIEARLGSPQDPRARGQALATCVDRYVEAFGVCGLPPLLSSYLYLAGDLSRRDGSPPQLVSILTDLPAAARRVWDSAGPGPDSVSPNFTLTGQPKHSRPGVPAYPPALHDLLIEETPEAQMQQQLPTPSSASYQAVGEEAFHAAPTAEFAMGLSHPMDSSVMHAGMADNSNNSNITPGSQFLAAHRPSFGSTGAIDHDAILDELGLMDRPDMLESESLFMANLGFPAAHMAHYPQDFMGFS